MTIQLDLFPVTLPSGEYFHQKEVEKFEDQAEDAQEQENRLNASRTDQILCIDDVFQVLTEFVKLVCFEVNPIEFDDGDVVWEIVYCFSDKKTGHIFKITTDELLKSVAAGSWKPHAPPVLKAILDAEGTEGTGAMHGDPR